MRTLSKLLGIFTLIGLLAVFVPTALSSAQVQVPPGSEYIVPAETKIYDVAAQQLGNRDLWPGSH